MSGFAAGTELPAQHGAVEGARPGAVIDLQAEVGDVAFGLGELTLTGGHGISFGEVTLDTSAQPGRESGVGRERHEWQP